MKRQHSNNNRPDEESKDTNALFVAVHEKLAELLNDNCEWSDLEKAVENAQTRHNMKVEVRLIGMSQIIRYWIMKGDYEKAEEKLNEYNATLPTCTRTELDVFEVIELFLRCFMERSKGDYKESYKIAKDSMGKVEKIRLGIVSTEFYVLAATVVNILAVKTADVVERNSLLTEAQDLFFKALRHLQDVHAPTFVKADLAQKLYTNLAMFHLGSCLAGDKLMNFRTPIVDKMEAQNQLANMNRIVTYENIALSRYRETQHHLAQSDLFYLASKCEEVRKNYLLKQALKFAEHAKSLAEFGDFREMIRYAQNRVDLMHKEADEQTEETSDNEALYVSVHEKLVELLSDNCEWSDLEKAAEIARTKHNNVEVNLICLSKLIRYCIIKGDHEKAEEKLNEYKATLPTCTPKELGVFEVIEHFLRCFMERSQGNYNKSYEIAKIGLQKVDKIRPGIVSTEFYVLAASVVNILAVKTEDVSERNRLLTEAKDLFFKALRHLQEVRTSKLVKADLEQKLYRNLAIFQSGSCLAGDKLSDPQAPTVDKTEAKNQLDSMNRIVIYENIALSRYRKAQHHLAQSDLFYLASRSGGTRKNYLLKQALKFAEHAGNLAKDGNFPEMVLYAQNRVNLVRKERENSEDWKWKKSSEVHRDKLTKLLEYGKENPEEVMEINGVRVCCSEEFLIGKGDDGTRVYVGLGRDGCEKAVKRLPKDACASIAEHEQKILNELNNNQSNHVVKYWFFDHESDRNYVYLIQDLCEETLESYVHHESKEPLAEKAPEIICQVLEGLADLHGNLPPILHRDLKPSNILRNVHGKWLLADFGISRFLKGDASTYKSKERGTLDWIAVESYVKDEHAQVRYKKESDIQVAGMVAYYVATKGKHPFGEKPERLSNLLAGKPAGLDSLPDLALKDLLSWMLSHDPNDRPSAKEALKHPCLQSAEEKFEMLCKVGNEVETKTRDVNSDVVRQLNSESTDWRTLISADVLQYLANGRIYGSSWTECLRLIRNVSQHWNDRPRASPQPRAFYLVGDPQEFFLKVFPDLPVVVHGIIRSSCWKERPDLQKYFG